MKAFGKYILVEPIKNEEQTQHGIILADSEERGKYKAGRGIVKSTGNLIEDIMIGDTILFKKHHELHDFEEEDGVWLVSVESVIAIE